MEPNVVGILFFSVCSWFLSEKAQKGIIRGVEWREKALDFEIELFARQPVPCKCTNEDCSYREVLKQVNYLRSEARKEIVPNAIALLLMFAWIVWMFIWTMISS